MLVAAGPSASLAGSSWLVLYAALLLLLSPVSLLLVLVLLPQLQVPQLPMHLPIQLVRSVTAFPIESI